MFHLAKLRNQSSKATKDEQTQAEKVVMLIFHNDLRTHDNATLCKAAELCSQPDARFIAVYASQLMTPSKHTAKYRHKHKQLPNARHSQAYHVGDMGSTRKRFLLDTLNDLDNGLQRLGSQLLYFPNRTKAFSELCELIEQGKVTDICVSQTADYEQNQAYDAMKSAYPDISWHHSQTTTLFAELPTNELPPIFSQFRKKVEYSHNLLNADDDRPRFEPPKTLAPLPDCLAHTALLFRAHQQHTLAELQPDYPKGEFLGGERNALSHLTDYFNSDAPSTYKTTRNTLDEWTHSTKFSAWLANGSLSVNTLLNRLRHYEKQVVANDSTYWIWFELLWREYFYWYAVTHGRKLFVFQGINHKKPLTSFYSERFERWKAGNTPYPIVNACMKQLNQTGYMSNRGRQLVASCFVHELDLDWRYGAAYFEQQLLDYDVASNWGNWQYLAGVGADPRGSRQFNLEKQTKQYDPDGVFIAKWQGDAGVTYTDSQDMTGWPVGYD